MIALVCEQEVSALIELLVVIAIIGILAALLLPTLARAKARQTGSNVVIILSKLG